MPKLNDSQVVTDEVIVIWDSITKPETNQSGKVSHGLSIAFQANSTVHQELEALMQQALMSSEFQGQLPQGAKWGILDVDAVKIPELAGWKKANPVTYNGVPTCVDANGQPINPTMLAGLLRAGSRAKLICHAYAYNKAGNKGVKLGLDGVQLLGEGMKLSVSAGMTADAVASAFGGVPQTSTPTPVAPQPVQDFHTGTPAAPAPVEEKFNLNGTTWTREQLKGAGWVDAQIDALPRG